MPVSVSSATAHFFHHGRCIHRSFTGIPLPGYGIVWRLLHDFADKYCILGYAEFANVSRQST
jgi:hypothetical protein